MKKSCLSSHSFTSRVALRAASLLMIATSATGCVAAKNYDEARSVAESEAQAHERTRQRLEASMERIHTLEQELAEREKSLSADDNAAAESKLATAVATSEKQAAVELVEQLRSELARTGDHLQVFAREKHDLAQTLLVAEQRMADIEIAGKHLTELIGATRDLTLSLRDEVAQGDVELGARDGQVVVGIRSELLFGTDGDTLAPGAVPLIAAISKVSGAHPSLRVSVRESDNAPASQRVLRLGDALRERGVTGARLVLPEARSDAPSGAQTSGSVAAAAAPGASAPSVGDAPNAGDAPAAAPAPNGAAVKSGLPAKYEIAFMP
jgi:flagellar motor protein MotB